MFRYTDTVVDDLHRAGPIGHSFNTNFHFGCTGMFFNVG